MANKEFWSKKLITFAKLSYNISKTLRSTEKNTTEQDESDSFKEKILTITTIIILTIMYKKNIRHVNVYLTDLNIIQRRGAHGIVF